MEDKKITCEEPGYYGQYLNRLKEILEHRGIAYWNDRECSNVIAALVGSTKLFTVKFTAWDNYVQPFVEFPFRVQDNTTAILALYLAQYNYGQMEEQCEKVLFLDADMGKLILTYGFGVKCPDFRKDSEEEIWDYVSELIEAGEDVYTWLNHLAVGKMEQTLRRLYRLLLSKAETLLQDREERMGDVRYGIKSVRELAEDPFCMIDEKARRLGIPTYREILAQNCDGVAAEQEREREQKSSNHVRLTLADFLKNTLNTETLPEVKIEEVPDAGEDEFWK